MTEETARVLMGAGVECVCRGPIAIKGKGTLITYFVTSPQEGGSLTDPMGLKRGNSCYFLSRKDDEGALLRNPLGKQPAGGGGKLTTTDTTVVDIKPVFLEVPSQDQQKVLATEDKGEETENMQEQVATDNKSSLLSSVSGDPSQNNCSINSEANKKETSSSILQITKLPKQVPTIKYTESVNVKADNDNREQAGVRVARNDSQRSNISIEPDNRSIILPIGSNIDVRVPIFQDSTANIQNREINQQSIVIVNNMYSSPITSINMAASDASPSISIINIHPIATSDCVTCSTQVAPVCCTNAAGNERRSSLVHPGSAPHECLDKSTYVPMKSNTSPTRGRRQEDELISPTMSSLYPSLPSKQINVNTNTLPVSTSHDSNVTVQSGTVNEGKNDTSNDFLRMETQPSSLVCPHTLSLATIIPKSLDTESNSTPQLKEASVSYMVNETKFMLPSDPFREKISSCASEISNPNLSFPAADEILRTDSDNDASARKGPASSPTAVDDITSVNSVGKCCINLQAGNSEKVSCNMLPDSLLGREECNVIYDTPIMSHSYPDYCQEVIFHNRKTMFLPFHLPSPPELYNSFIAVTSPVFSHSNIPSPILTTSPPVCYPFFPGTTCSTPPDTPPADTQLMAICTSHPSFTELDQRTVPPVLKVSLSEVQEVSEESNQPESPIIEFQDKNEAPKDLVIKEPRTLSTKDITCPYLKSFNEERENMRLGRGSHAEAEPYFPFNINDIPKRNRSMSVQEGRISLVKMKKFQHPIYSRIKETTRKKIREAFMGSTKSVDKLTPAKHIYDDLFSSESTEDSASESGGTDDQSSSYTSDKCRSKNVSTNKGVPCDGDKGVSGQLLSASNVLKENELGTENCGKSDIEIAGDTDTQSAEEASSTRKLRPDRFSPTIPRKFSKFCDSRSTESIFSRLGTTSKEEKQLLDRKIHVLPNQAQQRKRNQVFV